MKTLSMYTVRFEVLEGSLYNNRRDSAYEIINIKKLRKTYVIGQPVHDGIYGTIHSSNSVFFDGFENLTSILLCECLLEEKNKTPRNVACLA